MALILSEYQKAGFSCTGLRGEIIEASPVISPFAYMCNLVRSGRGRN